MMHWMVFSSKSLPAIVMSCSRTNYIKTWRFGKLNYLKCKYSCNFIKWCFCRIYLTVIKLKNVLNFQQTYLAVLTETTNQDMRSIFAESFTDILWWGSFHDRGSLHSGETWKTASCTFPSVASHDYFIT